jgi:hypothetical protein
MNPLSQVFFLVRFRTPVPVRCSCRAAPGNRNRKIVGPRVRRLSAGGNRIRTVRPADEKRAFRHATSFCAEVWFATDSPVEGTGVRTIGPAVLML